jgi:hypothetical protein
VSRLEDLRRDLLGLKSEQHTNDTSDEWVSDASTKLHSNSRVSIPCTNLLVVVSSLLLVLLISDELSQITVVVTSHLH